MTSDSKVSYRVDGRDEFVFVNDGWSRFALANDGAGLAANSILGRPLWDFIADATTEHLYREILRHVRAGQPARFTFRCDSPARRRRLEMSITARPGGEVQFDVETLATEERAPQRLLDVGAPRADDLLRICGWCKLVDLGEGVWGEVEAAVTKFDLFGRGRLPQLTHGICAACREAMSKTVGELARAAASISR